MTESLFEAHRQQVELLVFEAKNDVKLLEEKTSNWLNRLGMEYENAMVGLSKSIENLAKAQEGSIEQDFKRLN